ncbi:MAG: cupin domain-containing protein [Chloroflexi bacterium]|nr:cupin domain-containing protein [Chloroflexota bacterium]
MRVITRDSVKRGPGYRPAFGDQHFESEPLITDMLAKQLFLHKAHYFDGTRTKLHTHGSEQVLYCLEGKGVVGTETASWEVEAGDVVFIPAGESHWQAAAPGEYFSHLSIRGPGEVIAVVE